MSDKKDEWNKYICSFCGKTRNEVSSMMTGAEGVYICNECVTLCGEKMNRSKETAAAGGKDGSALPTPAAVCGALDDYVIGQEAVKKKLSVAVYNHYKRHKYKDSSSAVELSKANVLLIGPTGSGKTLLAQTLARTLDVPLAIVDATTLTEAGYVGEDVENIVQRLMQQGDYDMERVGRGIIYIDEIDKIARKSDNPSITRDVSGEGVQQALLKLIEGTIASVPPSGGRKHPHQEYIQVDTTEILFICGGAFEGLDKIIKRRCNEMVIGFGEKNAGGKAGAAGASASEKPAAPEVLPEDLIAYGLIPELVGRLPVIGTLEDLEVETLVDIFNRPKNALAKQYAEMLSMDGVALDFTEDGVQEIVERARRRGTGARGLRSVAEEVLMDIMFMIPSMKKVSKVVVDASAVRNNRPMLVMKGGARRRLPAKKPVKKHVA